MNTRERPNWGQLFDQMLRQPGRQAEYYRLFHNYSLGNQALAVAQMTERKIPVGPIASFNGWKKVGRKVKKGEKAIALWMPVVSTKEVEKDDGTRETVNRRFFIMKNNWFALAQTEPIDPGLETGIDVVPPQWHKERAMSALGIREVPFDVLNGNAQGFARPCAMEVAVNPVASMPWKTLFHEMAHCLLHSESALMADGVEPDQAIEEAEAEAVAYLCCASLGLPGLEESRAYVQGWLGSSAKEFSKNSAARVFAAADKILKAGAYRKEECHD